MFKEKYENDLLEEFKKECISKEASKMASDYQFVKGFVAKIMVMYEDMLSVFFDKNKKNMNNFFNSMNKSANNKHDCFLK